ncbi:MAG: restriction endonuclease [Promethearchaeota archaeon]
MESKIYTTLNSIDGLSLRFERNDVGGYTPSFRKMPPNINEDIEHLRKFSEHLREKSSDFDFIQYLWFKYGRSFSKLTNNNSFLETFLDSLYKWLLSQEELVKVGKCQIHKGLTLYYWGEHLYNFCGQKSLGRKLLILALIDDFQSKSYADIKSGKARQDVKKQGAYSMLCNIGVNPEILEQLLDFCQSFINDSQIYSIDSKKSEKNYWTFPELILLEFEMKNNNFSGFYNQIEDSTPKAIINLSFLQYLIGEVYDIVEAQQKSISQTQKTKSKSCQTNQSYEKGVKMEILAFYLFSCFNGFVLFYHPPSNAAKSDILIRNYHIYPPFKNWGSYILIECKNEKKSISLSEVNHLLMSMANRKIKTGIFVAKKDFSNDRGNNDLKNAKLILNFAFQRTGDVVFRIILDEIEQIRNDDDLFRILLRKYEEIQFSRELVTDS